MYGPAPGRGTRSRAARGTQGPSRQGGHCGPALQVHLVLLQVLGEGSSPLS